MQTLNFCILQGYLLLQLGYLSLEEKKGIRSAQRDHQIMTKHFQSEIQGPWVLGPVGKLTGQSKVARGEQ